MKGVFLTRRSGDWSAQFDKIPALHFIVQRRVSYVMNRSIASWTRCCHRAIPHSYFHCCVRAIFELIKRSAETFSKFLACSFCALLNFISKYF